VILLNLEEVLMTRMALAVAMMGGLALPALSTSQAPSVDLSGVWTLNPELNDTPGPGGDPGGAPGDSDRGDPGLRGPGVGGPGMGGPGMGGPGGGLRGPGGMGGPGMGDPGASRPNEEEMRRMRDLMQELFEVPSRFTITQRADQVVFTEADGPVRTYMTNGKAEKHQLTTGTVETRTRWEAGALVMDIKANDRMTITRRYTLDANARRLTVTTTMPRGRGERVSVYEDATND
jgi:hypothetical protein